MTRGCFWEQKWTNTNICTHRFHSNSMKAFPKVPWPIRIRHKNYKLKSPPLSMYFSPKPPYFHQNQPPQNSFWFSVFIQKSWEYVCDTWKNRLSMTDSMNQSRIEDLNPTAQNQAKCENRESHKEIKFRSAISQTTRNHIFSPGAP